MNEIKKAALHTIDAHANTFTAISGAIWDEPELSLKEFKAAVLYTDALEKLGIDYDVCPGVSAFCGAAAALRAEYTLPNVSQTVIITRAPGRTPVPTRESIRALAAHHATMVLFLSTSLTKQLQADLLAGGYEAETPAAVVYKATWPEEKIFRCTVGTLHDTVTANGLTKTSLIVVGGCLGGDYLRSLLYDPSFTTEFREATK